MNVARLLVALSLVAVALPFAAPTAAAYCVAASPTAVAGVCLPYCPACIILANEVLSLHCSQWTDAQTTTVTCGTWLTGDKSESAGAPLPAVGPFCLSEVVATHSVTTCPLP